VWSNALISRRPRAPPFSSNRPWEEDCALRTCTCTEEVMDRWCVENQITLRLRSKVSDNKNDAPTKWGIYPLVRRFYLFLQIHRQESIRPPRPCSQRKAPVQWPGAAAAARIQFPNLINHQTQDCSLPFFFIENLNMLSRTLTDPSLDHSKKHIQSQNSSSQISRVTGPEIQALQKYRGFSIEKKNWEG